MKERLYQLIDFLNVTVSKFERDCNLSNGYIKALKSTMGADKIENVLRAYPQISRVWLMTGEGDMIQSHSQQSGDGNVQVGGNAYNVNTGKTIDELVSLLKKRDEQIDRLITLLERNN